ncbi:hypothetical protein HYS91_02630 [Candidatus Daviesbacteria bacterium]|nr:hypothetical protein [Candidatus Daviesbacteria bacterium]
MLTVDDIKKLAEVFVTKEELKQEVEKLLTRDEFNEKYDKIMNMLDKVYGEVKTMREEQAAHTQRHEDVENRLIKIETIPSVAHELKKKL